MRCLPFLALFVLACEPMDPSGDPFAPVAAEPQPAAQPAPAAEPASPPAEGFDFESDERPAEEPPAEPSSPEELARAMGIEPDALPEADTDVPAPAPEEAAQPLAEADTATPPEPAPTPMDGSWGIRLVSTVPDAQPPRAILGLPDGTEEVVQPGTLLPAARIVVLAVGRDAVQVAEIIPAGDHARIETQTIRPLYAQDRGGR